MKNTVVAISQWEIEAITVLWQKGANISFNVCKPPGEGGTNSYGVGSGKEEVRGNLNIRYLYQT